MDLLHLRNRWVLGALLVIIVALASVFVAELVYEGAVLKAREAAQRLRIPLVAPQSALPPEQELEAIEEGLLMEQQHLDQDAVLSEQELQQMELQLQGL